MRVASFLVVALCALGSVQKLSGQETSVLLDLTKQTAYLLQNGGVALVSPIASGEQHFHLPFAGDA
jgi:hypothetical protein